MYFLWPKRGEIMSIQDEIRRKAEAGIALTNPNSQSQALYDQHQKYILGEIQKKANSGTALDTPNAWKQAQYDSMRPQQTQGYASRPQFDQQGYMDQINNLYNQQREAELARYRATRDKAVGQLNQQKAQVTPQYQGMRNQADAVNLQNVQKLREIMAANGLNATGENVTAQTNMANQRQNSINSLNLQEQQTMDDFERRIADYNNQDEENAMIAAIEAERSRALMGGYGQANDNYWRQKEFDYQIGRDSVNDSRWQQQFGYQTGRDNVNDSRWQQQFDYQKQQEQAERAWREYTFNNLSASEREQLELTKAQYGEDAMWREFELKYKGNLELAMNQAQIDFYKNADFNQAAEGGGYTNNYKTAQQSSKSPTFSTYQNHLQQAIKLGVPANWANALTELVGRESSWNHNSKNPNSTAYGYGQFLKDTRTAYEKKTGLSYGNPVHQLVMMTQYVKDRYGTPEKALAFWDKNRWY